MNLKSIMIGKQVWKINRKLVVKPKRKYRVIIQERLTSGNRIEKCRSFMIYDFNGKTNIDKIKAKMLRVMK